MSAMSVPCFHGEVSLQSAANCSHMDNVSVCSTAVEYVGYMYFYTPITITGFLLNVLNLLVFQRTQVRSTTLTFLYVLAVCDMVYLSLAAPLGSIRCLPVSYAWEKWARGLYEIYIFLPLVNLFGTVSLWTSVILSVDRYIHVRQSKKAKREHVLTPQRQRVTIAMTVLCAIALNLPYIFYKVLDDDGDVIDSALSQSLSFEIYTWIRMVMIKMIPVVMVALANAFLLKIVIEMNRKRKLLVAPFSAQERQHQMQMRVSVMLVSISIVFLLCHMIEPLSHSPLYAAIFGPCEVYSMAHYTQIMVTNTLEMISHGSNFIFYCIFNRKFKEYLGDILCCRPQDPGVKPTQTPNEAMTRH